MVFYSAMTGGFYHSPDGIPPDAVEISDDEYKSLLDGQANKLLVANAEGHPVLIDPPPRSPESYARAEREWRDDQLTETDGVVSRHRDELEAGGETTLTPPQYSELQAYRRALRGWPESGEFPLIDHRPTAPPWLAEQIQ
ncbi:phage tail assembly chaperone [Pseudomonas sp. GM17]|uniref:phage tail assembly chaperone n=1 Tax=Pseudomonas sp. GM17 TaxID=1144323 RepID=UPI00056662FA|nr:phage tail assembly chaperone [Pseudomonas sp. GM17]WIE52399.1 phage tail assembly chaperone [Pseudomonas sp. GM17]